MTAETIPAPQPPPRFHVLVGGHRPPLLQAYREFPMLQPELHKPRLARLSATYSRHPLYFVTICTAARRPLLANPETHHAFVAFGRIGAAHGVFVGHYVLMPDHLHAFVSFAPGGVTLSAWVKSLKNCLSKQWRAGGKISPHWQKSFFDHLLRTTDSYGEKWEYVLLNPVRAGLVAEANQWPYRGELHPLQF